MNKKVKERGRFDYLRTKNSNHEKKKLISFL